MQAARPTKLSVGKKGGERKKDKQTDRQTDAIFLT